MLNNIDLWCHQAGKTELINRSAEFFRYEALGKTVTTKVLGEVNSEYNGFV